MPELSIYPSLDLTCREGGLIAKGLGEISKIQGVGINGEVENTK